MKSVIAAVWLHLEDATVPRKEPKNSELHEAMLEENSGASDIAAGGASEAHSQDADMTDGQLAGDSAAAAAAASEDGSADMANTAALKQEPKGKNCEDCGQPWKVILKTSQAKYAQPGRQLYLNREYLKNKPYDDKLLEECKKLRGQTRGERASVLHYDEQEEAGSPEKGTQGPNGNTNPYLCPDCWHKFLSEWRSKSRATGGGEDGTAAAAAGD